MSSNPYVQAHPRTRRLLLVSFVALSMLISACSGAPQAKTYTVGVVNYVPSLEAVLSGFKARMAELGYVEGDNITYVYHGITAPEAQAMDREVRRLQEQKIDLFLTMGTLPTLTAKRAVAGTTTPVVFAPVINPVEEGAVDSISHPGGNVTGVQNGYTIAKAMGWLHDVVPHLKKIYVIYSPKDEVALTSVKPLSEAASKIGVELVLDQAATREEALASVNRMPADASLFLVPTPSLNPMNPLIEAAVKRGIAVGSSSHNDLELGALVTYGASFTSIGNQAARMADKILKGTNAGDMPIETAEFYLKINLKTANAMGLDIPDAILKQATEVVR